MIVWEGFFRLSQKAFQQSNQDACVLSESVDPGAHTLHWQGCRDIAPETQEKAAHSVSTNLGIAGTASCDPQVSGHTPSQLYTSPCSVDHPVGAPSQLKVMQF